MNRMLRTTAIGATAALALVALALPTAALAAPQDNGGSARQDYDGSTARLLESIETGPAKNVILLIGDGMGDSEITIARNYAYGAGGELPGIDALPLTGQYTTYALNRAGTPNAGKPDYVPDSAATGTAWATGTKTYDNAVGVDIAGAPQDNLIEIAKANGLRTGNVTTSEIQDATPAVQGAHVDLRGCYGPDTDAAICGDDLLERGGLGSISEQLIDTRADITLGGGAASFGMTANAGPWSGKTLVEQARDRGFTYVTDAAGLSGVAAASQNEPLLGLFSRGNLPTRFLPSTATVGGANTPVNCTPNPASLGPALGLKSLTEKAIDLLDDPASEEGFFLQVEGASIDKRDHAADACGQIGETIDLDEAVQAALEFAEADGETMVIVTADHAHTSQIVDSTPLSSLSTAVNTVEGSVMRISYGTAPSEGGSQQHTGTQLRIAGYGPGAAAVVGLTDQTDTFFTIAGGLELDRDVTALSGAATAAIRGGDTVLTPGQAFTVDADGFRGDRQLASTATGGVTVPAKSDLIYGATSIKATAPTALGTYTVDVKGNRTGTTTQVTYTVTASGEPTTTGGGQTGPTTGGTGTAGGNGGSSTSPLANTGLTALPYLLLAAGLVTGGALFLRHRRRQAA